MILDRFCSRYALPFIAILTYAILYIPIIILICFSFNDAAFPYTWGGFTWRWYRELLHTPEIWDALYNTFIVATSSAFLSLVMGVLFVCWNARDRLYKFTPLFYAGVALPEIVIAVGLLSFFSFFAVPLGMTTLIAGHTLLGLGFVVPIVRARYLELDYNILEASLDLGATEFQTFFKVTLPLLMPAIVASGLLVFILSLDDFLIAFFCSGTTAQTLTLYIFSMIRLGVSPMINAVSTLMLFISSIFVLSFVLLNIKKRVL